MMQELPGAIIDDPGQAAASEPPGGGDEAMKIAWRYQHMPQVNDLLMIFMASDDLDLDR